MKKAENKKKLLIDAEQLLLIFDSEPNETLGLFIRSLECVGDGIIVDQLIMNGWLDYYNKCAKNG